jgi:hypothetical protein
MKNFVNVVIYKVMEIKPFTLRHSGSVPALPLNLLAALE